MSNLQIRKTEHDNRDDVLVEIAGHPITADLVRYVLCSAFEGGSNYWYRIDKKKSRAPVPERLWPGEEMAFWHLDWPLQGGELVVQDKEGDEPAKHPVNRETIIEGLKIMAKKYLKHFTDMVEENHDATTGDVLLQCIVFEDAIFG